MTTSSKVMVVRQFRLQTTCLRLLHPSQPLMARTKSISAVRRKVAAERDRDPRRTTPMKSARQDGAAQIVLSMAVSTATREVAMWGTRPGDKNAAVVVVVAVASQTLLPVTLRQTIRYVPSPSPSCEQGF